MKRLFLSSFIALWSIQIFAVNPEAEAHWYQFAVPLLKSGVNVNKYTSDRMSKIEDIRFYLNRPDAEATSTLASKTNRYSTQNMRDGNTETAWCEGSSGGGAGEIIKFSESDIDGYKVSVLRFEIIPGYTKDEKIFKENSRPKGIKVKVFKKSEPEKPIATRLIVLPDSSRLNIYSINLPEKILTKDIQFEITINSTYSGTKYQDMCITELRVVPDGDEYYKKVVENSNFLEKFERNFLSSNVFVDDSHDMTNYSFSYLMVGAGGFLYNKGVFGDEYGNLFNMYLPGMFETHPERFLRALFLQQKELRTHIHNVGLLGNIDEIVSYEEMLNSAFRAKKNGVNHKELDSLIENLKTFINKEKQFEPLNRSSTDYPIQYELSPDSGLSAEKGESDIIYFVNFNGNIRIRAKYIIEYQQEYDRVILILIPIDSLDGYVKIYDRGKEDVIDEFWVGEDPENIIKIIGEDKYRQIKAGNIQAVKGEVVVVLSGFSTDYVCDKLSYYAGIQTVVKVIDLPKTDHIVKAGGC